MAVDVTREVIAALEEAALAAFPCEACGILLGCDARITGFVPAANVHASPETHFEIDPQALVDAHRAARAGGPQVLGYFHSHPRGEPEPSATDRAQSPRDGRIWAIMGRDALRFWEDAPQGFRELSYSAIDL